MSSYPFRSGFLAPATALLLAGAPPASAQVVVNVAVDSLDLPQAVVIGNRAEVALQSVGHTFDVITRAELERLPINSVAEALQYVPGLDLRQRGPLGVQADLSIRGGTFDQVLVLINGIRMADPQTGHHVLNIPVPLENVERIEVLKGPGARLYGQNAFAGAINIVTKHPTRTGIAARATAGDNGLAGFGVSGTLTSEHVTHTLSYGKDLAQGYRPNTDFDITNTFYQATLPTDGGTFEFLGAISERAFGANGFYASPDAGQQYEEVQTSVTALTHKLEWAERYTLTHRVSWRRNQDEYVFVRRNPSLYRNLHVSHDFGYDGYLARDGELGRLGVGLDVRRIALSSNLLGQRERTLLNLLVEHAFTFGGGRVGVTPGATLNYFSDAGARVLPALDVFYRASDALRFYGNFGTTYRVPTYTDLYYEDPGNVGNPDLLPERAVAFEAGAQYDLGGVQLKAAAWQRSGSDLIDYQRDSTRRNSDGTPDLRFRSVNLNDVTFRGLEASVAARRVTPWLPLASLGYNLVDGEINTARTEETVSRYALDQVRHQLTALVTFRPVEHVYVTAGLRYADRVNDPLPFRSRTDAEGNTEQVPVPPRDFTLVDARVEYRRPAWSAFVDGTNLGDVFYSQSNGVPLPGRWLRGGLQVRL